MRRALIVKSIATALVALASLVIADPAAAQAKKRVVNVYNWSDYIDPTVIDEFTKNTGITVRYDTFDSNDTLETKLLAVSRGADELKAASEYMDSVCAA